MLGTTTDRAGRALVSAFMDIPEAPNVFVAGDAAMITQNGHPVPGVAQAAIQQGRFVGHVVANRQGTQGWSTFSIPQQRQYGGGRQELRRPRGRSFAHKRLSDLAGVGRAACARVAAASEPFPRSNT